MRGLLINILALFVLSNCYADNISIVTGTWNSENTKKVSLFTVERGVLKEIASSVLTPDNKFYFALAPEQEGFYVIGIMPETATYKQVFYLKSGDRLNVIFEGKSYLLTGVNTPENKEMEKWHNYLFPVEDKANYVYGSSTYIDFFPLFEEKLKALAFYGQAHTENPTFNKAFEDFKQFDILHKALRFITTPRSIYPQNEDFPEYYKHIDITGLTATGALMQYPYGRDILLMISAHLANLNPGKYTDAQKRELRSKTGLLNVYLPQMVNDTIKGEFVLQNMHFIKTYEDFLDFENQYGKYLVTDDQKARLKDVIATVVKNTKGEIAIDFSFPDKEGKATALSDFKGKVVYIDVWATWCGPCIKEIPYIKNLEAEYHGKNIVFLSISVDNEKDRQKWADFIQKEELKGIQLFAGSKSKDILGPYKIKDIPRFILVGKDGKLITAEAPRPSSSEIRSLLNISF
ncbi:MAG: TlpA family protein disulfide reductase [Dysgonamonadaceae bacterium]|jgi:thiol-disulfide isomerase/thioredoxin|nr:TlpA family protein disulfide reductase [Dysgonamonadaceae bacterium]